MFRYYNPNPKNKITGDCVIRGVSILMNKSWEEVYFAIAAEGFIMCDMPSSNRVWENYLVKNGYSKKYIKLNNYTVYDFCIDHPDGKYLLATGTQVIAVIDGNYYDNCDSGDEIIIEYYTKY